MKYDLEDRLVNFSCLVLQQIEELPDSRAYNHLASQLVRSSTAPTLVYGEACAAESPEDFIHKMGVALKELKESRMCLMIIRGRKYSPKQAELEGAIDENEQLIAIFGKSINTARENLRKRK